MKIDRKEFEKNCSAIGKKAYIISLEEFFKSLLKERKQYQLKNFEYLLHEEEKNTKIRIKLQI